MAVMKKLLLSATLLAVVLTACTHKEQSKTEIGMNTTATLTLYEYPSTDADGKPVTISGIVMVPSDVDKGEVPCDGIILFNHATLGSLEDAPSQGGLVFPSGLLANPLKPNYIVVMSDYIGFGSSKDHPYEYLCGHTNGRNSLDGLLAARQMLTDKNIPI